MRTHEALASYSGIDFVPSDRRFFSAFLYTNQFCLYGILTELFRLPSTDIPWALWWNKREQMNRPHGWAFAKITNGVIRDMKLWKPVAWSFSTSGSNNVHAYNNRIFALSDDPDKAFPFNTDGFSAGGTNLLFENNHIQNGDDCLTVGNGAKNIIFRNSYCEGGHGLSIGSLGKGGQVADVQNVLIENVHITNSLYGARFKSWTGGNGLARNITWRNIKFDRIRLPIYVTQNYWDQNLGPKPTLEGVNSTHIEDMTFENFIGTIEDSPTYFEGSCISDPCWYYVEGATGKEAIIFDLYPDTAKNIVAKRIIPATRSLALPRVICNPETNVNRAWTSTSLFSPTPSTEYYLATHFSESASHPMAPEPSHLEELQLIQCSLLPGESMEFVEDAVFWDDTLSGSAKVDPDDPEAMKKASMAIFTLKVDTKPVWLQVTMYMQSEGYLISVKGDNLSRREQERWQEIIKEKEVELEGTEFPLYNLLSQLVPMLHEAPLEGDLEKTTNEAQEPVDTPQESQYHVLFTSHHLISTKKRKSLQQWSASLKLAGFAKVGYPGVIYAQGTQENLEEFVGNVKAMQWLALRVRFVEPVPDRLLAGSTTFSGWQEFSRVGEVVEEMKRLGREEFVLEMGIGSSGNSN
ncbi:hypothetical protein NMY22_g15304 [Coprinellus aureogranulatus]|nr:hypothetical protein NMY22_g15304 [Coprinellus aureogranulatus]